MKLPHVRQLQESSVGLSRGGPAGYRLDAGRHFLLIFTVFAHFEALRVDSQHLIKLPPPYLPRIIDLLGADLRRSGGPQVGVLWEPQETPRRPQETPRKPQERKK